MAPHEEKTSPHLGFILWRIEEGYDKDQDLIKEKYSWYKSFTPDFTGLDGEIYYDQNDPRVLLQIAGWKSVAAHYEEAHHSEDFGEVIQVLGGFVDVRANFHVNIPYESFTNAIGKDVIWWQREWIADDKEDEFTKKHAETLAPVLAKHPGGFGWRISGVGWDEKDVFDYFDLKGQPVQVTSDELSTVSEMNSFVGFDSLEEFEAANLASSNLASPAYARVWRRMDLHYEGEGEDDSVSDEDSYESDE